MTHILTPRRACFALTYSLVGALIILPFAGFSPPSEAGEVLHWNNAWVRSMPPAAQVTAAYGQLMNHGDETVTITGVTSAVGAEAQMHDVVADGDQRRMTPLTSVEIAPGEALTFQPGGRHIMLLGVVETPSEGSQVKLCALSKLGHQACTQARVERQAPATHDAHTGHHQE